MHNKRKLLIALFNKIGGKSLTKAVEQMWDEGLLDITALERLYIGAEIERRVCAGETKTKAIEQLSNEMCCSYEKVRAAVYHKHSNQKKTNGNTN